MSRHTLLDLLGTEHLPDEIERRFMDFCVWQQAHPAIVQILESCQLPESARTAAEAASLDALGACVQRAAASVKDRRDIPVMALGTIQGVASEVEQIALHAGPVEADAGAVSFHAARLVGWASWARNKFGTGMFKTSAEEVAYGEQLQALMQMLGAQGV